MKKKYLVLISFVFILALFSQVDSVGAAELDVLDLNTSTDKATYENNEEITTHIKLNNTSDIHHAEKIKVSAKVPNGLEIVDEDLTIENGNITWSLDEMDEGSIEEFAFTTILRKTSVPAPDKDNNTVIVEPSADTKSDGESTKKEKLASPQTGDESTILPYVVLLLISVAIGIGAFIILSKKSFRKIAPFIVAFIIITPAVVANADTIATPMYTQSISQTHTVQIADEDYTFEITVTAEVPEDLITSIQVDPNELELYPETEKTVNVTGTKRAGEENINADENLSFVVSDSDKVIVTAESEGVHIAATEAAEVGDEVFVEVIYQVNGEQLTDTVTVKIVEAPSVFGTIKGQITDAITGEAIEGATIEISDENDVSEEIVTDENGEYEIELLVGNYQVNASATSYIPESLVVEVTDDNTTQADVNLELVPEANAGIGIAEGQVSDALSGDGLEEVDVEVVKGKDNPTGEVIQTIKTDANGNYSLELPGGSYTLLISTEGYISTTKNIIAIGEETKANQNATITPVIADEEYRIVLTWGEEPRDLDSHFTGPTVDGERFHVYFASKNYGDADSEVNLDLDDVSSYGPETTTVIKHIGTGTYTFSVFNYSGRNITDNNKLDLAKSSAKVEVYKGSSLVKTYNVPTNKEGNLWKVFEIRNGEIVTINKFDEVSRPTTENLQ